MDSSKGGASSIFIHDLRIKTKIGVWEWEKRMPQNIRLDLEFGVPSDKAFTTGELSDALDYSKVVARIRRSPPTTRIRCSSASRRRSPTSCWANSRRRG